jgi:hypothetical protein
MANIHREREIELLSGKTVTVDIEVEGIYDSHYGADGDGGRGVGRWLIDSHSYVIDTEETLTDDEESEIDGIVEELVYEGEWDWESAANDEANEYDEDLF